MLHEVLEEGLDAALGHLREREAADAVEALERVREEPALHARDDVEDLAVDEEVVAHADVVCDLAAFQDRLFAGALGEIHGAFPGVRDLVVGWRLVKIPTLGSQ